MTKTSLYAATLSSLEEVLAEELRSIGAEDIEIQRRLVSFTGDKELLYKSNLLCRTAIRILYPIDKFAAWNEGELYRRIQKIRWNKYIRPRGTIAIDPIIHNSTFTHSLYVAQLTKDAIVDQFRKHVGVRPSVNLKNPDVRICLYMNRNNVILSLDSSGDSLHKRGYRIETNAIPLNEVLASGIIQMTGWKGECNFIDPMCGSGTFLAEAAMIALGRASGYYRENFGFMNWKDFDADLYQKIRNQIEHSEKKKLPISICGSDINHKYCKVAEKNIHNADLSSFVRIQQCAFEQRTPPKSPGILIMNPPYGERQKASDLEERYKAIGDTLKQKYQGYNAYILTGNLEAAKHIGLKPSRKIKLFNGAIECRLLKFEIYEGTRKHKT